MAIIGAHVVIYTTEPEALRATFRDVFGFPHVDAGDGWLIFALPPGELGVHPVERAEQASGRSELYLMCNDIGRTVEELQAKGVEFTEPVTDEGFGLLTRFNVPGAGQAW